MKRAILALLLSTVALYAETAWLGVEYKEVRAYAWKFEKLGPTGPPHALIREDMSFVEGVINKDGAPLSRSQINRLLAAHARPANGRSQTLCYAPRNAFVFYNGDKKAVAYLEVCFDCLKYHSHPKSAESDPDYVEIAKICAELKLPIGLNKTVAEFKERTDWLYELQEK